MRLINAMVTEKTVKNTGMDSLSMSASNELEPGPRSRKGRYAPESVGRVGIQVGSREAQAKARAVGWGGFTGG
jgi:hypothetical protein